MYFLQHIFNIQSSFVKKKKGNLAISHKYDLMLVFNTILQTEQLELIERN